jgi:hypothetical protein
MNIFKKANLKKKLSYVMMWIGMLQHEKKIEFFSIFFFF